MFQLFQSFQILIRSMVQVFNRSRLGLSRDCAVVALWVLPAVRACHRSKDDLSTASKGRWRWFAAVQAPEQTAECLSLRGSHRRKANFYFACTGSTPRSSIL